MAFYIIELQVLIDKWGFCKFSPDVRCPIRPSSTKETLYKCLPAVSEAIRGIERGTTAVILCTSIMVASVKGIWALWVREGTLSRPRTASISAWTFSIQREWLKKKIKKKKQYVRRHNLNFTYLCLSVYIDLSKMTTMHDLAEITMAAKA